MIGVGAQGMRGTVLDERTSGAARLLFLRYG